MHEVHLWIPTDYSVMLIESQLNWKANLQINYGLVVLPARIDHDQIAP